MNEPVKQHYIPQSYLKYFATEEKEKYLIDAYDFRMNKFLRNQNISRICFEKHLYSLNFETIEKKYFVEKFYADNVDAHFTEIHDILTNPDIQYITAEQKEKIVLSMLSLYFRTTKFLHGSFNLIERLIDDLVASSMSEELNFTYQNVKYKFNKSEVYEFKNRLKEEHRLSFVLSHIDYWQEFYKRKLSNGLQVCRIIDNVQLITSDNPVIIASYNRASKFNLYDPTNIIQIPIDKNHYLFMLPDEDTVDPLFVSRGDRDKWFALTCNKQMQDLSERWIISELGGIEKHLELQRIHGERTTENLEIVRKQKEQLVYYMKLKDLSDKFGGDYSSPEVIKLLDEYSTLDIFKDDPSFLQLYYKVKNNYR